MAEIDRCITQGSDPMAAGLSLGQAKRLLLKQGQDWMNGNGIEAEKVLVPYVDPKLAGSSRRKEKGATEEDSRYAGTANPQNSENTQLHCTRYRSEPNNATCAALNMAERVNNKANLLTLCPSTWEEMQEKKRHAFREQQAGTDWSATHLHLKNDMDVVKFVVEPKVQQLLHHLQTVLVDEPYNAFGKTTGSWEGYTLMFRNGFPSKDLRKPCTGEEPCPAVLSHRVIHSVRVADIFQQYCEEVYCPIIFAMLYGHSGWAAVRKHWSQFKACTIKVSESADFWGENIFHMHIDGKIGLLQEKNYSQSRMSRMLFSIVTDTLGKVHQCCPCAHTCSDTMLARMSM